MKKLFCLLILIVLNMSGMSQTIYTSVQPVDLGLGLRYDQYLVRNFGLYSSISYGNYWLNKEKTAFIKAHIKTTLGILIILPEKSESRVMLSAGLNYHSWRVISTGDLQLNQRVFDHWSYELGVTTRFKHLSVGVRTDILRWEPCLDIGIPLISIN